MWKKITKNNIDELKVGDEIRYHNSYEWCEEKIDKFELDRGYILTGVHNETCNLLYPNFGDGVYFKKDGGK